MYLKLVPNESYNKKESSEIDSYNNDDLIFSKGDEEVHVRKKAVVRVNEMDTGGWTCTRCVAGLFPVYKYEYKFKLIREIHIIAKSNETKN